MLFTVDGFAFGMWAGHIAAIRAALDLSPAALSLALFGLFTGAITNMSLTGALSRRFALRRLSIAGAVLSLPALVLPGIAGSLGALVAAAIAFGASRGVLEVAMNTVASELQAVPDRCTSRWSTCRQRKRGRATKRSATTSGGLRRCS